MSIRLILLLFFLSSCAENNRQSVSKISSSDDVTVEIAKDVEILYSDSAQIKVRIISPTLKRYRDQGEVYDEFPDGLNVEFMDNNQRVKSWLTAEYALRKENEKKIFIQNNVELYNKNKDELLTEELIWDEGNEEIYTNKLVKIRQPSRGDTSLGIGFRADQEFTEFEISRKFSAIKNIDDMAKDFK